MPTLLMLTYHFPPSAAVGGFRLLSFAQQLPRHGWRVAVVAPPSLPWEPDDPSLADRVPAETLLHPVPYPRTAPKVIRWAAPYAIWLWPARQTAVRVMHDLRPDAILTSGPPHGIHLLGLDLKRRFGVPWVADFRDPWMSTQPMPRLDLRGRWERSWEARVMARADVIVGNTRLHSDAIRSAYPRVAERLITLPNGFDPEAFPPPEPRQPGPLRIVHAGQLYDGRDPAPLLDAVQNLPPDTPPFRLEFLGRTKHRDELDLDQEVARRGLQHLVVNRGQVPHPESLRAIGGADILLVMHRPGRKIGVPAKLYEYLGSGRPILALIEPDGDPAAVLSDSGVPHRTARSNDPAAIRAALLEMVHGVAAGTLPTGDLDKRLAFSRERLAGRLAEVLSGFVVGQDSDPDSRTTGAESYPTRVTR